MTADTHQIRRPSHAATRFTTSRIVTATALALLGVQFLIRGLLGSGGYFSLDDFVFYTRASEAGLWDHDFLLTPYNGHLMPGAMAWVWLSTKAAPLDFDVVFATMLVLQLIAGIIMYFLLRMLFGNRPAILVPLAVFAFSTITLPASWWWAAAINQQPQQIAILLVLMCHFRYVASGRWYWALAGPVALVAGLLFFEKTVLVVPLVGLITWLFFSEGALLPSLVTALRRYWLTWVAYLAVLVSFTLYYVSNVPDQRRADATTQNIVELFDSAIRQAILPGLLGGPWRWSDTGVVDSNADPHPVMQIVSVVIVGGVIALSILVSRTAMRAWGIAVVYLVMLTVLLSLTRGSVIGAIVIGSEYRYLTDFCLVIAVCGALAFLAPVIRPWWKHEKSVERDFDDIPSHVLGFQVRTVVGFAIVALVASSIYSANLFANRWSDNPAKTYVANASNSMKQLEPGDRIYNGVVPTKVVWRLLYPANLPTRLLAPLGLTAKPLAEGETTSRLQQFSKIGTLETSLVEGVGTSQFETKDCLVDVRTTPRDIPLTSTVFDWPWIMQIDYVAEGPGTLTIVAGDTHTTATIGTGDKGPGGRQSVYAAVEGGYNSITLSAPGNGFCIKTLAIGAPQPNEW
jgi:hypothetical protein